MRTIQREIVGGFIFSKDGKVLLGKNRKGGHYEGSYVVPWGRQRVGLCKRSVICPRKQRCMNQCMIGEINDNQT